MLKRAFLIYICLISLEALGQNKAHYRVFFTDKGNTSLMKPADFLSSKSIARREMQHIPLLFSDYPLHQPYVTSIERMGIPVVARSKWFNYVVIEADEQEAQKIKELLFVRNINKKESPYQSAICTSYIKENFQYDYSNISLYRQQLRITHTDVLNANGFRGQGVLICLMDDGYMNLHQIPAFRHLFQRNSIEATYDFVDNDPHVYDAGGHGTAVLSNIAAILPQKIYGGAYDARYLLTRTENNASESRLEEDNWVMAAEWADSIGADIFSTSLGYSKGMTDSLENYTYAEMDGNTTIITRAADLAATKGILVINSAGNDGNSAWRYISAPADGDSVLTVGAVDSSGIRSSFSSFGPTADGRLKPEVVTLGTRNTIVGTDGNIYRASGTSFSCPLMTALAASLWSSKPKATAWQIRETLIKSAHQYTTPDTTLGYGIPDARKAFYLLHGYYLAEPVDSALLPAIGVTLLPNPARDKLRVVIENRYNMPSVRMNISSIHGQTMLEHTYMLTTDYQEKVTDADVAGITSGIYYITLSDESGGLLYRSKVVINR